jgi:proline dehydrogenase
VFRSILLYLAKARWARRIITGWKLSRLVASRFIAGDTLDDAVKTVRALNAAGLNATLDHLGEAVTTEAEARRAADDYLVLIDKICETGVRSNASLKLSQLGLNLSRELCLDNLRRIVRKAADCGLFIRIDMEDTSTVDWTLEIWRALQRERLTNVGLVFQSYLYRTEQDIRAVLSEGCRIRLCKGAYKEPASIAWTRMEDIRKSFSRCARLLLESGSYHAIATHDESLVQDTLAFAREKGIGKDRYEFQMLYGLRSRRWDELVRDGHNVRIYVPYGTHWLPYFYRRLREKKENVLFVLRNLFGG